MKKELNLLVTLDLSKEDRERIQAVSDGIKLKVSHVKDAAAIPDDVWTEVDALYTGRILPDPVKAPKLKWVQFDTAGVDRYLADLSQLSPEVTATTMSGVITAQIAEYIVMTMLAMGHKVPLLQHYQAEKSWPDRQVRLKDMMPVELRNSTVGILGYGSIGREVARLLQPFTPKILAVKRDVMHPEDTGYTPEGMGDPHGDLFHRLYPMEALHSVLAECDFVVVTLPLTDQTRYILNADAFAAMKKTAYLVNVGRGALIDERAFVNAVRTREIAGAALDVFEQEPLPAESPLWDLENVILSPHISWVSDKFANERMNLFIENLNRYMAGLPLYNRVDMNKGY
jgi:phosphoglycerate dehydrogenase-like enzyme